MSIKTCLENGELNFTPFEEISKNYKQNKFNKWHNENNNDTNTASRRFDDDFFFVNCTSNSIKKFKGDYKVFTMGSCFARNIEESLRKNSIEILTDKFQIDPSYYTHRRRASAVLNKFNIPSMLYEFERALGMVEVDDLQFIEVNDEVYFDTGTAGLKLLPLRTLREIRDQSIKMTRKIIEADVFIVTLGLVEMFIDNETMRVLNTSPHPLLRRKYKERFSHARPGYDYLKDKFFRLISLLRKVNQNLNVVVTVSPVPLQATMLDEDIVSTNTYSKSLLRVLAQESSNNFDNVFYFPSYEMVMNSPRNNTWELDNIHVKSSQVDNVTSLFIEQFFQD